MGYTFEKTVWPATPIDPAVKELIERYYVLADTNSPESADLLADEVFTETGVMKGAVKSFSGSKGLQISTYLYTHLQRGKKSRDTTWLLTNATIEIRSSRNGVPGIIISRRHEIHRVFVADDRGHDLMLIGTIEIGLKGGRTVPGEFATRMVVDDASVRRGSPRLSSSQVYTVCTYYLLTVPGICLAGLGCQS